MNFSIDSCLLWNHFLSSAFVIVACKYQNQTFPFSYSINESNALFILRLSFEVVRVLSSLKISSAYASRAFPTREQPNFLMLRLILFYVEVVLLFTNNSSIAGGYRTVCFGAARSSCLALVLELSLWKWSTRPHCVKPSSPVSKKKKK